MLLFTELYVFDNVGNGKTAVTIISHELISDNDKKLLSGMRYNQAEAYAKAHKWNIIRNYK